MEGVLAVSRRVRPAGFAGQTRHLGHEPLLSAAYMRERPAWLDSRINQDTYLQHDEPDEVSRVSSTRAHNMRRANLQREVLAALLGNLRVNHQVFA